VRRAAADAISDRGRRAVVAGGRVFGPHDRSTPTGRSIAARWPPVRKRVGGYVRASPATFLYLLVIGTTSWVLATSGGRIDEALLRGHSSNLSELARDPVHGLVQSAFWVEGWPMFLVALALGVALAPVERWLGTPRWLLVFSLGHIVATLLVAGAIWGAIRLGQAPPGVRHVVDVGASYGFAAVAGVATYRLPLRAAGWYVASVVVALTVVLAVNRSFTDAGHLVAFAVGLACRPLARSARDHVAPGSGAPLTISGRLTVATVPPPGSEITVSVPPAPSIRARCDASPM
jgi:Rhomboid-like protein